MMTANYKGYQAALRDIRRELDENGEQGVRAFLAANLAPTEDELAAEREARARAFRGRMADVMRTRAANRAATRAERIEERDV